jgi:TM2 domain-containing membrane protein YozV
MTQMPDYNELAPLDAATLEAARTKKIMVGVLAILLGPLGVHKFVLGYLAPGFVMFAVSVGGSLICCFSAGAPAYLVWIVGLIEGIIYLSKPDDQFHRAYIASRRPWF